MGADRLTLVIPKKHEAKHELLLLHWAVRQNAVPSSICITRWNHWHNTYTHTHLNTYTYKHAHIQIHQFLPFQRIRSANNLTTN